MKKLLLLIILLSSSLVLFSQETILMRCYLLRFVSKAHTPRIDIYSNSEIKETIELDYWYYVKDDSPIMLKIYDQVQKIENTGYKLFSYNETMITDNEMIQTYIFTKED